MLNHTVLMGRLVKDVEIRYAQGGDKAVAKFTVAVERDYKPKGADKPETDFISCTAFNKTAEFISKYFKKGSMIAVVGRIQTGSYEKDGKKIYTTDVAVEKASFTGESKKDGGSQPAANSSGFGEIPEGDDDDLPF